MSYVIKKYSNRKLYDTVRRRYTTLNQIGDLVRSGEEGIQVIEESTRRDITATIMAMVIAEGEKGKTRTLSIDALRKVIREGEDSIRELADKYAPKVSDSLKTLVAQGRKATDRGRRLLKDEAVDLRKDLEGLRKRFVERYAERLSQAVYKHGPTRSEVLELTAKIDALNQKLDSLNGSRKRRGARRPPKSKQAVN